MLSSFDPFSAHRTNTKWSGFRLGSDIQKPNHFKSRQMATISSKIIWNPDKNAHQEDFEWMVLFWNGWDHLKFNPQKVLNSNVSKFCCGILDPHCIKRKYSWIRVLSRVSSSNWDWPCPTLGRDETNIQNCWIFIFPAISKPVLLTYRRRKITLDLISPC